MVTQLDIARDPNSIATYIIALSSDTWQFRLAADTELTLTVPAGAVKAIISGDDYYYEDNYIIDRVGTYREIYNRFIINADIENHINR